MNVHSEPGVCQVINGIFSCCFPASRTASQEARNVWWPCEIHPCREGDLDIDPFVVVLHPIVGGSEIVFDLLGEGCCLMRG